MKPTRDDLWIRTGDFAGGRKVTDKEFHQIAIAQGYVKLDKDTLDRLLSEWGGVGETT